jgi:hypothetical protein
MAINFINAVSALAASASLPTHQPGDILIAAAFRTANVTASLPSGWIGISSAGTGNLSLRLGFRVAQSSSDTSGTWTNATGLSLIILRPTVGTIAVPGALSQTAGISTSVLYGAVGGVASTDNYLDQTFVAFGSTLLDTNAIETAPTGMTFLEKSSQSGLAFASFRLTTNAFGSWTAQTVTLPSATWRTGVVRIAEYPFPALGGGGGGLVLPRSMSGGYAA